MKREDCRIIFMGTPEFAVPTLQALVENRFKTVAVVTQPDKPVGRHGSTLQMPPVKKYAIEQGIPVLQPEKMKDEAFINEIKRLNADLQIVVAFRMLPEIIWNMPRLGTFNVHASLLPQYRGAAPINWAIINGEKKTGVTTFFLDKEIDTGRIIMQRETEIPDDADAACIYEKLMYMGAELCLETTRAIIDNDGLVQTTTQKESSDLKIAPKIFKHTCKIDWENTTQNIYNFIRGISPYPGANTKLINTTNGSEQDLKIYKTQKTEMTATLRPGTIQIEKGRLFVNNQDKLLEIIELQLSGKRKMNAKDFINGINRSDTYILS